MSQTNKRVAPEGLVGQNSKKVKILDVIENNLENRYDPDSSGPFLVIIVDRREDFNLGNYHPMIIGKYFRIHKINLLTLNSKDSDSISITFPTYLEANEFIDSGKISNINSNWSAYIPRVNFQYAGVIRDIPKSFTEEDVKEGITDEQVLGSIVSILIIKKRVVVEGSNTLVSTGSVKIVFNSALPEKIKINNVYRKVFKFIPLVKRCFSCQRYGHINSNCMSFPRCVVCGQNHESSFSCTNKISCANCKGDHKASDLNCPCFKFQKEVNLVKTLSNINFIEAKERVLRQ